MGLLRSELARLIVQQDVERAERALASAGVRNTRGIKLAEFGMHLRVDENCRNRIGESWTHPNLFDRGTRAYKAFDKVIAATKA